MRSIYAGIWLTLAVLIWLYLLPSPLKIQAQSNVPDLLPELIKPVEFEMSAEGSDAGLEGILRVAVEIDKKGNVKHAEVIGGPAWPCSSSPKGSISHLKDAAEKATLTAKFAPAHHNGLPVDSRGVITLVIGKTSKQAVMEAAAADLLKIDKESDVTVKEGVVNGKALRLPKPTYPGNASNISSQVWVEVVIDKEGRVVSAGASYGPELLRETSRKAACKALFSPTLIQGIPVFVTARITYNFVPSLFR
ncbi:MAG: hypothetical protein IPI64_12330 [Chloracidobacterium sp.]|nr:hypothetical protein [Chloracidobacterium sp.]